MSMKDPLIEWLIATTPLKRDTWVLECQLYRILLSYIRGNLDRELIITTFYNTKEFMNNHFSEHRNQERTLLKMLVEQCDWSVDMFVTMIEEKKGRL